MRASIRETNVTILSNTKSRSARPNWSKMVGMILAASTKTEEKKMGFVLFGNCHTQNPINKASPNNITA